MRLRRTEVGGIRRWKTDQRTLDRPPLLELPLERVFRRDSQGQYYDSACTEDCRRPRNAFSVSYKHSGEGVSKEIDEERIGDNIRRHLELEMDKLS